MAERGDVPVGSATEEFGYRHSGQGQDESCLGDIQGKELRAKSGGVVRSVDEKVLFIAVLGVGGPRDLYFLGEEDGFNVLFFIEHIHPREDGRVLEGRQTLFEGSVDVPGCRSSGIGRGSTGVRDIFLGGAVARGADGGCEKEG